MIIDLFFENDDGPENLGSITLENGKLTAVGLAAKRLISEPLVLDTRQHNAEIDPQKEPERFMKELPEAYRSSRQWAKLRGGNADADVAALRDIPLERGDV